MRTPQICPYCEEHGGDGSRCSVGAMLDRPDGDERFATWRESAHYWRAAHEHARRTSADWERKATASRERLVEELGVGPLLARIAELEAKNGRLTKEKNALGTSLRAAQAREAGARTLAVRDVCEQLKRGLA